MKKNQSSWVSLADMMTGLMLVFLLIAILMVQQIVEQQEKTNAAISEHQNMKKELYNDLNNTLKSKKEKWGLEITEDLVVRFDNPKVLFVQDSYRITPRFREILNEFVPLYLSVINKDKYEDTIREVRIVGHTAGYSRIHNSYIDTVRLSQNRARRILGFVRSHEYYDKLSSEEKEKLTFLFTANGYGLGRAIDDSGSYVYETENDISSKSRRVEFSVITNSEELIKNLKLRD